jgi:hypothetical protein
MEKVKQALSSVLRAFEDGNIPEAVSMSTFPTAEVPMNDWSFLNRTLVFLSGTADARGYRQWQTVNRQVKKGAKALYILVPLIKKREEEDEEKLLLYGFKPAPVFRAEDTDGEPLDYQQIELPEFPLMAKAEQWGISVKAIPGNYKYYGYFSPSRQEIALATKEECVFFHELVHCAESRLNELSPGQEPLQEIVADLGAQALCLIVGKSGNTHLGNSYRYIAEYAGKLKLTPIQACLRVLARTEKALTIILKEAGNETKPENNRQHFRRSGTSSRRFNRSL